MTDRDASFFTAATAAGLLAACTGTPYAADPPACSVESSCRAEDVPSASLSAIRSNGDFLSVSCPLAQAIDAAYRARCAAAMAAAIGSLARWPDRLSPPNVAEVPMQDRQTCVDTFVPGREAVDCEYHFIEAKIPLRWR